MIVKVCFGDRNEHMRIVECDDLHFEDKQDGSYTEMIYHGENYQDGYGVIHFGGKGVRDHVYIMDKGETVDHMVFLKNQEGKK